MIMNRLCLANKSGIFVAKALWPKMRVMKQWAKREAQIERMMNAIAGMYGDLHGIAGKPLQEIEGLEMKALGLDGDK